MTVQVPDRIRLDGSTRAILGVRGGPLFAPGQLGWKTQDRGSANWRGSVATYGIAEDRLVLAELSMSFAYDALDMKEPLYVIERRDGGGEVIHHHPVHRQKTRLGPPEEEDVDVALPGLVGVHWLTFYDPDRFELSSPSGFARIADGEEVEVAPYLLRPRVAAGFAAVATSPLPRLLGYEGTWTEGPFPTARYVDMASPIPFHGGLICGGDLLRELYPYGGRPTAWRFGRVEELIFEEGALRARHDRSMDMALVRAWVKERAPSPPLDASTWDEIEARTKRCFELDY